MNLRNFGIAWIAPLLIAAGMIAPQIASAQNRAPSISGQPPTTATVGVTYRFKPIASDPNGDRLYFTAFGLPRWLTIDRQSGLLSGTPSRRSIGTTGRIVIAVSDRRATSYLPAFAITVSSSTPTATNTAPSISGVPATAGQVGQGYAFQPIASDADGDALTFAVVNKPSWAIFSAATGALTGTPTVAGTHADVTISVSDGKSTVSLSPYTIEVAAAAVVNTAPTISGTPAAVVISGSAYSFQPSASDADGDALTFSIASKPAWATFDGNTGRLSGTPTTVTTHPGIVISVSDGKTSTSLPMFSIQVQAAPNRAPTISGTPLTSVTAGTAYSFQPSASDPDGNTLGFSVANKPSWASFSTTTGRLSGTPTTAATHAGIVISVSDGKTSTSLPAFTLNVSGSTNRAPVISGTPTSSLNAGSAYSFTPSASDADGDALTFSIANKPAWASFNTTNGQLAGTPAAANVGTYSNIVITVSDGKTTTSLSAFAITVTQTANGSAQLSWTPPTQNTDGTQLTDLAGYRIYYGTNANSLTQTVDISNASVSTYVIGNLSPATWYFAVKARNTNGTESDLSNLASKTVL